MLSRTGLFSSIIIAATLPAGTSLRAQITVAPAVPLRSPVQLFASNPDAAVFDLNEARKDIPCNVTPVKPLLGFDLRFHAGYEITVPLRELSGESDLLTIIFRVAPSAAKDSPVYFVQKFTVPSIDEDARGDAALAGRLRCRRRRLPCRLAHA